MRGPRRRWAVKRLRRLLGRREEMTGELNVRKGRKQRIEEELRSVGKESEEAERTREIARKSAVLLEAVSDEGRREMLGGFQNIVSYALQAVFGKGYEFGAEYSIKRNLPYVDFVVRTPEYDLPANPMDSKGGGVIDVLSFALRVCLLELFRPKINGPVVLDEPFKHLSGDRIRAASAMLRGLSRRIGRQFIVVTHKDELAEEADNVIRLGG